MTEAKKEKQDAAIRRAIHAHEHWRSQWVSRTRFFGDVEMVSPRGKLFTHTGYQFEVNKHLTKTIEKIRKALGVTGEDQ